MSANPSSIPHAREPVQLDPCIETTCCKNAAGYGVKRVNGVLHRHHRIACAESHGVPIERLKGLEVMHLCDNPACVNPKHLQLGTHTDNMRDMFAKGRRIAAVGEKTGRARLTDLEAKEIRESAGSHRAIAARFGIDPSQVSRIKTRKTWRHL